MFNHINTTFSGSGPDQSDMYIQVELVDIQHPIGEPGTKSEDMTESTEIGSHSTLKQLEHAAGPKKTVLMTSSSNVIARPVMKSKLIQSQESKDSPAITCNDKIPPQPKVKLGLVHCVGSGIVRDSMANAAEINNASTMDESFPETHDTAQQQQLGADTTSAPRYRDGIRQYFYNFSTFFLSFF
jgi:hypothetical protein